MLGPLSPTPKKTDMLAPTPTATNMLSPTELIVERLEKLESGSRERPALLGILGEGMISQGEGMISQGVGMISQEGGTAIHDVRSIHPGQASCAS